MWQPIDTAPKEGAVIHLKGKVSEWVGSWRKPLHGEPQAESHKAMEWREEGTGCWANATHWMPPLHRRAPYNT